MSPDEIFVVAARRLAELVTPGRLGAGALYPPIADLRTVTREVAIAVAGQLRSPAACGPDDGPVDALVDQAMWWPAYLPLLPPT